LLANPNNYPSCTVKWKSNNKLKTLVYNEDFVQKYFYNRDVLNGIYTMGEGAKEIEEEIKRKNDEINKINEEILNLTEVKKEKENKELEIDNNFKEICWKKGYNKFQNVFPDFFTGYRNNKNKFKEKILEEYRKRSEGPVPNQNEIMSKYNIIYSNNVQKIDFLPNFNQSNLTNIKILEENQTILQTAIVGKKDINISKIIEKLCNHDWVKQGKEYYDNNFDENRGVYICPFCQQDTSDEFRMQLEEYFDETFTNQMKELENYIDNYKIVTDGIQKYFQEILSKQNQYLEEKIIP
jgi:wobble nucleotide-excising tRNase